jgi:hypothetical protein
MEPYRYTTILIRPDGSTPEQLPTPIEYAGAVEFYNTPSAARDCRGRSVDKVILLHITTDQLLPELFVTLNIAMLTHQGRTGIKPTFITSYGDTHGQS